MRNATAPGLICLILIVMENENYLFHFIPLLPAVASILMSTAAIFTSETKLRGAYDIRLPSRLCRL